MNKIILILSYLTITSSTLLVAQNIEVNTSKTNSIKQTKIINNKVLVKEKKSLSDEEILKASSLYKRCAACHGQKAERKALGKSDKIQNWDSDKIYSALKGYKNGTFGGNMKGIMKGQVVKLNDEEIKLLSEYIPILK